MTDFDNLQAASHIGYYSDDIHGNMGLLELPTEILYMVFSYIEGHDLRLLSETCGRVRSIVLCRLFSSITLRRPAQILYFGQSLSKLPTLATYVKTVNFVLISDEAESKVPESDKSSEVWGPADSQSHIWLKVLGRLPRMSELCLECDAAVLSQIASLADNPEQYLGSLEVLSIYSPPFDLVDLVPVLSLHRLSVVTLQNCIGSITTAQDKWQNLAPPKSFNIEQLILDNCCIDVGCMEILVRSCKTLKHLSYTASQHDENLYNFTPNQLSHLLLCQQESLITLEVGLQLARLRDDEPYEYGPFDRFSELRSLRIEQIYMGDNHKLPDALRKLCLEDCEHSVFSFLRHATSALPHLEMIVLLLPRLESSEDLSSCGMLDVDLATATKDQIEEQCKELLKIYEDTKVLIHHDPDIWGKVEAARVWKSAARWELEGWDQ